MFKLVDDAIIATRDNGPRFKNESALFYALKKWLIARGHDVIKKRPDKDGHLTSMPYYIRWRDGSKCVIDNFYAIRDCAQRYNEGLVVRLDIVSLRA